MNEQNVIRSFALSQWASALIGLLSYMPLFLFLGGKSSVEGYLPT